MLNSFPDFAKLFAMGNILIVTVPFRINAERCHHRYFHVNLSLVFQREIGIVM